MSKKSFYSPIFNLIIWKLAPPVSDNQSIVLGFTIFPSSPNNTFANFTKLNLPKPFPSKSLPAKTEPTKTLSLQTLTSQNPKLHRLCHHLSILLQLLHNFFHPSSPTHTVRLLSRNSHSAFGIAPSISGRSRRIQCWATQSSKSSKGSFGPFFYRKLQWLS